MLSETNLYTARWAIGKLLEIQDGPWTEYHDELSELAVAQIKKAEEHHKMNLEDLRDRSEIDTITPIEINSNPADIPATTQSGVPSRASAGDDYFPKTLNLRKSEHQLSTWGKMNPHLTGILLHTNDGRHLLPEHHEATMHWGKTQGYLYSSMNLFGEIVYSRDFDMAGSHIGRRLGWTHHGVEVCNPGRMQYDDSKDLWVPWYNNKLSSRNASQQERDRYWRGEAVVARNDDEAYRSHDLFVFTSDHQNIRKGAYLPMTKDQMESLIDMHVKFKSEYPHYTSMTGHDEVTRRKSDPGGSVNWNGDSLTMSDFRALLERF